MSGQVVRLRSGGVVAIRTGIVRGAGPSGPMGPPGPRGLTGVAGPTGAAGSVNDLYSLLTANGAVVTASDGWDRLSFNFTGQNDLLVVANYDGYAIKPVTTGLYQTAIIVTFDPRTGIGSAGVAGGSRRLRLMESATGNTLAEVSLAAAPSEPTIAVLSTVESLRNDSTYYVEAFSDDSAAINVTERSWALVRVGAGPAGPTGPLGPPGATGAQGPIGPNGSAGGGYSSYNAVTAGGASENDPGGTSLVTADQGIATPAGAQVPATPFFIRRMVQALENRLVARYTSAADRATRRPSRFAGEVTFQTDNNGLYVRTSGIDRPLAQITLSTAVAPSAAGAGVAGQLWLQY